MEEQLISFETAKLAKEKGFDIPQLYFYIDGEISWKVDNTRCNNRLETEFSAPTQSLLQRWLREKHGVDVIVLLANTSKHCYIGEIWQTIKNKPVHSLNLSDSNTYEETLEKGLQEALKLIK